MNYTLDQIQKAYEAGQRNMAYKDLLLYFRLEDKFKSAPGPATSLQENREPENGPITQKIIDFLISKGSAGAKIKEIAQETGFSGAQVRTRLYANAKKRNGIESLGRGTFVYKKSDGSEPENSKPKILAKSLNPDRTAKIINYLKTVGKEGASPAQVAQEIGESTKTIGAWLWWSAVRSKRLGIKKTKFGTYVFQKAA